MLEEIAATPLGDLSMREPVRVQGDATLIDVVTAMRERRRGAAIVEDGDGRLVGIFTERDLMLRVDHGTTDWHKAPVRDVMTEKPASMSATETLANALNRMKAGSFRHMPVIDDKGVAIGIASVRDILRHIVEHFPEEFINLPPDPEHEAPRKPWGG